jgi:hypothetical protein
LAYDPTSDGFVFSSAEINRAIDRGNRLEAARLAVIASKKPQANRPSTTARAA